MPRVLLLFVDGVGVGAADVATNPFMVAQLPRLRSLLGGQVPTTETLGTYDAASAVALDATLGVPGIPQSGTGQAALLTGLNAPELHGSHFGPWVPTALRPRLGTESVLARAQRAGHDVAFANAYPEELTRAAGQRRLPVFLRAGPPWAALAAGLMTRHTDALREGRAVASEIVNDGWRERLGRHDLPEINEHAAGTNLVSIARQHQLTLFAHYSTDSAGHEADMAAAVNALERFDRFLGGIVDTLPGDTLLLVVSDHGNIEDVRTGHTRNPALSIIHGANHAAIARGLHSLMDVTPAILRLLGGSELPAVGDDARDE